MTGNIVMGDDTSIGIADDAERIEFDGAGDISVMGANLGIGTVAPLYFVDLANEADTQSYDQYIRFGCQNTSGTSGGLIWRSAHSEPYSKFSAKIAGVAEGNYFRLGLAFYTGNDSDTSTNAVERMRINSSGNVGIGTASPTSAGGWGRLLVVNNDSGNCAFILSANSGNAWEFGNQAGVLYHYNGSHRLTIAADGTFTGSGSADISDERLKENITTIPDALQKINALTGRTFTWKEEADMDSGVKYGLIAQELEAAQTGAAQVTTG